MGIKTVQYTDVAPLSCTPAARAATRETTANVQGFQVCNQAGVKGHVRMLM